MTDRVPCPVCATPFEPKTVGNRVKEFCSRACKDRIWKLLREWAHEQYRDGIISAEGLLAWGARRSRCTAPGEPERESA